MARNRKALFLLFIFACSMSGSRLYAQDWVYSVRQGDTLWDLCLEFTIEKACWLKVGPYNQVDYPPALRPGTRIRFPIAWLKAQPASAEIIFVRGDVFTKYEGEPRASKEGDLLSVGAQVQSGKNSSASIRFADGSILVLEENSHIELDALSQHGNNGMVDSKINLHSGSAKTKVNKMEVKSQFRVSTPSAIAAVRGTEFRITATADSMLGEVFEGNVNVSNAKGVADVEQGNGIKVKADQQTLQPTPLLPAPIWLDSESNTLGLPASLRWEKIEQAQRYNLQILSDSDEDKLIFEDYTEAPEWAFVNIENGCYRFRLSAFDPLGLRGMPVEKRLCVALQPATPLLEMQRLEQPQMIKWQAADNATSYLVEVSTNTKFSELLGSVNTTETQFDVSAYSNQNVYVRVIAVTDYDIKSEPSKPMATKETKDGIYFLLGTLAIALISLL